MSIYLFTMIFICCAFYRPRYTRPQIQFVAGKSSHFVSLLILHMESVDVYQHVDGHVIPSAIIWIEGVLYGWFVTATGALKKQTPQESFVPLKTNAATTCSKTEWHMCNWHACWRANTEPFFIPHQLKGYIIERVVVSGLL